MIKLDACQTSPCGIARNNPVFPVVETCSETTENAIFLAGEAEYKNTTYGGRLFFDHHIVDFC
jgi:hypothetical protein